MGFLKLSEILKRARQQNPGFEQRLEEATALSRWEQAVGPQIAKHAQALRVQDGVLWVEVDHSIWKSELHHRKRQILTILNQQTAEKGKDPHEILKDILFVDPRPTPAHWKNRFSGKAN
jgi:predicted nucleic acid-binding Zn ribbon protein